MELATPPQNAHLRGERQGRFDVMTIIMDMMAMMVNIIINIKLISSGAHVRPLLVSAASFHLPVVPLPVRLVIVPFLVRWCISQPLTK